jgi:hypothetical protein
MSEELPKPLLDEAMFKFTQEGNCMDAHGIIEIIEIKCQADIGIDGNGSCFYVLKTEGWSIDSLKDLELLFNRMKWSLFPDKQLKQKQ